MPAPQHVYEIFIRATPERVWEAITDPETTRRYFHHTAFQSSLEPGSAVRYLLPDGDTAIDGVLEIVEPGRRLVMTWRALYDPALAAEPPSRVDWTLAAASDDESITRVTLRHYDLALSPGTWASVRTGWLVVIDGLKTLLETGHELGDVVNVDEADASAGVAAVERKWHRALAIDAHNSVWELLDGRDLTATNDGDELLARAYAAQYHWRQATDEGAIQRARASYTCAKAHLALGDGDVALRHAQRCAQLTTDAGGDAADFDRAYALEIEARALACVGRADEARARRAAAAAVAVADEEDRAIVESDLAAEPWFGI